MKLFPLKVSTPSSPIDSLRDDTKFASTKIAIFQYLTVGVFLFLITGFWELQVQNEDVYNQRAEKNRIKAVPILAPRGKILDREGRVIVDNQPTFSLILSRENLREEHLKPIAEGLNLDYAELVERLKRFRNRPRYEPIVIKEQLTPAELAFVEAHRDSETFPEMELIVAQRRLYPKNGFAAHLIGYVGEVSEAELNTTEFVRFNPGDIIGKTGIERQYNDVLMGIDGQRQVVVDNRGIQREVLAIKDAVPGKNLQLTIDLDLQAVAELAMEGKRGGVIALDPRNGEVLAMVSRPTFDPNRFAGRIRPEDWREIMENPERPLLNRTIQAQFAPGSTFKPIMALAGLESGVVDDHFTATCPGGATFYGRYFKCHKKSGHGRVDLHRALVQSCDVFFYTLGNRLGIDTIARYAEMVGFGKKTGIDLPHEAEGLVPSSQWKLRTFREKWFAGETISVSIGQGALTVTPIQLAYAIGGIATGGVWIRPHLVKDRGPSEPARRADINVESAAKIVNGMWGVVNEGGTAAASRLPGIDFSGKTGTAQLASNTVLKGSKLGQTMKDNAWFVGFAPREPEIVVVALYEGGEHGSWAAPIVRDIIKAYFDKKARKAEGKQLLATTGINR
ncbi:MAG: penicillin-binding protein 2 [Bryobacteraceae bacterium]|nr:penicillin-binding protein 2 [Bryobacteraceae bacterium]